MSWHGQSASGIVPIGAVERRLRHNPDPQYWRSKYWQVDTDPGQRLPRGFFDKGANVTSRGRLFCNLTFGNEACVPSANGSTARDRSTSPRLLFYTSNGRLSNCLLVLELARWLAEQLDMQLVVPLCSSGENTEQSCKPNSKMQEHKEVNLLVNISAVYSRSSLGGCHHHREARDVHDLLQPYNGDRRRTVTCVGRTPSSCAWMLGSDYKFVGLSPRAFREFDVGLLTIAWLTHTATHGYTDEGEKVHRGRELRRALRRQDGGEPCTPVAVSVGCPCDRQGPAGGGVVDPAHRGDGSHRGKDRSCTGWSSKSGLFTHQHNGSLPPCLRDCHGQSLFDAAAGDIFLPNLFDYATHAVTFRPCPRLELSTHAAAQVAQLRSSLPSRFVCMHWRAGDFLSPNPLGRFHGASLLSRNGALANETFMAAVAVRAAIAARVRHVLVLTNAKFERGRRFEQSVAAASPAVGLTMRVCTDAPPDAEKEVCARGAAALVLSKDSSFSAHIHSMASSGTPVEYLSSCPRSRSSIWRAGQLLAGSPIDCS